MMARTKTGKESNSDKEGDEEEMKYIMTDLIASGSLKAPEYRRLFSE